MAVHRLTVDAYAVQHPGRPSPQTVQSVAVHLISLHAVLELGLGVNEATRLIGRATESEGYRWLTRPGAFGDLTVADVVGADSAAKHVEAVRSWAECAYGAWQDHHDQIREWAGAVW